MMELARRRLLMDLDRWVRYEFLATGKDGRIVVLYACGASWCIGFSVHGATHSWIGLMYNGAFLSCHATAAMARSIK